MSKYSSVDLSVLHRACWLLLDGYRNQKRGGLLHSFSRYHTNFAKHIHKMAQRVGHALLVSSLGSDLETSTSMYAPNTLTVNTTVVVTIDVVICQLPLAVKLVELILQRLLEFHLKSSL